MKNLVAIFIFFFVSLALNASSVDIIRPSFLTIETQPSDSIVFEGEKTKFETKAKYLSNEWNYIGFCIAPIRLTWNARRLTCFRVLERF